MDIITQNAHYRKRMIGYAKSHSVTEAAIRYKTSRKTVYKWIKRYDGTIDSLKDQSHRPKTQHPNAHKDSELKMIIQILQRTAKGDRIRQYQLLQEQEYKRSYGAYKRVALTIENEQPKPKRPKQKPRHYDGGKYPGDRFQIDVKYLIAEWSTDYKERYVYVAKDEFSRWTFRMVFDEHNTYSSQQFLKHLIIEAAKINIKIREVQTDNGTEFTSKLLARNADHKSLFEKELMANKIEYRNIRIGTPRHNGRVERQNRTDEMRFYSRFKFSSAAEWQAAITKYNVVSNDTIMTALGMKTPNQILASQRCCRAVKAFS